MKTLIIILTATLVLLACSPTREPSVSHEGTTLTDCFTPVPAGNIIGLGFNGQPRALSLANGANVRGALDTLVNDLGATFARVEVFDGETDWEATQDNADPNVIDWSYFDAVFSQARFQRLWAYVAYLNQLGIAHVELAQHGGLPMWMGTTNSSYRQDGRAYVLPQSMEDEFVETCIAMMLYARTRAPQPHPHFDLFSPWNEPEFATFGEGIDITDTQRARVLRKLTDRMNALPDLAGIQLVVGEDGSEPGMIITRQAVQNDTVVMARTAMTSYHRYGDASSQVFGDWRGSTPPVAISELNSTWNSACYDTSFAMGLEAAGNLLLALQNGATAGLVWSDVDAVHEHQGNFQTFGVLATTSSGRNGSQLCNTFTSQPSDAALDAMTYAPKPTYYALRHIVKWIRPNASPLTVTASGGVQAVAYKNADGTVVVAGRNGSGSLNSTVTLTMTSPPSYLTPRTSTASTTDVVGSPVPLSNGVGSFSLPAQSVFTLLSSPGSGGSGGAGGMGGMSAGGTSGSAGAASGNGGQGGASGSSSAGTDQGGMSGAGGAASGAGGQSGGGQGGAAAGASGASGSSSGGAGAGGQAGASGAAGSGGTGGMMVAAWSFDEGSGTVAHDTTGHGHDGTLVSSPAWTTGSTCKFGGCLTFSGTGKRVTVPDAPDLDLDQAFTIMAWVKPTSVGANTWRPVLIKEEPAGLVYLLYASTKSGWIDIGGSDLDVTASGNLSTTALSHIAMERNGAELSYWLNGTKVATRTVSGTTAASTGVLAIGGHSFWGGEWMAGTIDDVRVYNYALSSAQIASAMGSGL